MNLLFSKHYRSSGEEHTYHQSKHFRKHKSKPDILFSAKKVCKSTGCVIYTLYYTPKSFSVFLVWFIAARCQGFYSYVSFRATRIRLLSTTTLLPLVVTKPPANEQDFRGHPRVWMPRLAGRSGSSMQPNASQRAAPTHQSRASLVSNALCPFFSRSNNPGLILVIQSAGVSRGRNGFRKDKSGEKFTE